jgi:hypothetical protein
MVSGVGGSSSVGWAWTVVSTLSPSVVFQPQAPQVIIEYRQVAKRGLERFSLTAGMLPRPNQSKIASYTWSLSSGKIVGYGRSLSYRLPYRVHQRIFLSAVNQRQLSGVASVNL